MHYCNSRLDDEGKRQKKASDLYDLLALQFDIALFSAPTVPQFMTG